MFRGKLYALWAIVTLLTANSWAEFQVHEYTQHQQTHAAVAMNDAGDFAVVWRSHAADGRGGGVYARSFYADGQPASEEFKVNVAQVDMDNWTPAVALGPTGDLVVVWVASQDGNCDVVARMFDLQGLALTEEFAVHETPSQAGESMPAVATSSTGDFVVVWASWSAGRYVGRSHIMARLFGPDGLPSSDVLRVSKQAHGNWPDVALDGSGRFVVTWIRTSDTYNRPYGEFIRFRQFEADGTPLGDVVEVIGGVNGRWYGPSVAVDSSGQFLITWAMGPLPYDILAQHFDSYGVATAPPYLVNLCMEGNQGHPEVATNGDGTYLIVWDSEDQDGSCTGVFSQCCTRDGAFAGPECAVNTFVLGRQWYPDVAMVADGRYVVVWISEEQDGSGYGIFARTGP